MVTTKFLRLFVQWGGGGVEGGGGAIYMTLIRDNIRVAMFAYHNNLQLDGGLDARPTIYGYMYVTQTFPN